MGADQVKRILIGLALAGIIAVSGSGCGQQGNGPGEDDVRDADLLDRSELRINNDYDTSVFEIELSDGTHCVIVTGYESAMGVSCDWD